MGRVTIEGTEVSFTCPPHENMLRAALRQGLGMPYDCTIGTCGECKVQLVEGKVQPHDGPPQLGLSERDVARGRILACQAKPDGDCVIRAHLEDRFALETPPSHQVARLESIEPVSPDMMRCRFVTEGPAAFLPGQYARILVPGTREWRAFSMANLPNDEGVWEFMIRVLPGGVASTYFFAAERSGEPFIFDAPYGNAYYRPGTPAIVCLAGGAGLAPTLGVARAAAADPACRSIQFVYGGRSPADLCAETFVAAIHRTDLAVECYSIVSGDHPDWGGAKGMVHEFVEGQEGMLASDADYYVAGPPPMVDAVLGVLAVRPDIAQDRVFYDRFFG